MDSLVCRRTISDADVWVQPDAFGSGKGVVDVDEAAFGGFDVVFCEGIGDAAEVDPVNAVKGFRVECNLVTHKRGLGFQCFFCWTDAKQTGWEV